MAIDRALSPYPRDRFPSMAALVRAAEGGYRGEERRMRTGERTAPTADETERAVRDAVGYDYEILSRLGSGTFGTVWRARDLSLEREVALKVLHPRIARDADAVNAFWREAKLAAQLAHPAIVPIYDWDGRAGLTWYTMELAEGGSVAQLIARRGARSVAEIAPHVDLLLDGLSAAHAIGVVHRDLKPDNVLIDRYLRWRLTDFGIANVPGAERPAMTGTLGYSAPEQLLGEPQGPAVDCFALAAVVVFVLTGAPPFMGVDAQVVLAQQLGERAPLDSLPPAVMEWARTGLAPNPAHRFADASAMLREWRVAVEQTRRRERAWRWWRRMLPRGSSA
jgi:serine/threonine-protein kinase